MRSSGNYGRIISVTQDDDNDNSINKLHKTIKNSKLVDGVAPKQFARMNTCHQFLTNVLPGFPANLMLLNDSRLMYKL